MHRNGIFDLLICINNHVLPCLISMLSNINTCIKEVMTVNEEANFQDLPLDEPTLELKTLPSTLKYAFLDTEQATPVIILSQLHEEQGE